jgi:tRNA pseudouridine55 synthase
MPSVSGLLNLLKPGGMTSRAVVDRVQRLVRPDKAGHAGTLDPLATGVLVVGVGAGTRLIEYVQRMPKRYRGTFLFGRHSPTEDIEGDVELLLDPPVPSRAAIEQAVKRLTGEILQRPPSFSALKVAGQRAYDLARAGKPVDLEPRPITVYELRVIDYDYPEFSLEICCSGGTYVRSLGRDLAESLGTAAVMSALVREAIGDFTIGEALPLAELSPETVASQMQPLERALCTLPRIDLSADECARLARGQSICRDSVSESAEIAGFDPQGHCVSILKPRADGTLGPARNFFRSDGV